MTRKIIPTNAFKHDYKRLSKSNKHNLDMLKAAVNLLANGHELSTQYRDHTLIGNWKDHRECHLQPDWLLIYRIEPGKLILVRTGSHAQLFGK